MKTNIRTAKSKLFANATIYYVPSKSGGEEHIVVHNGTYLFCDCRDFMTRHLPLFGTSGFSACTHGRQVTEFLAAKTAGPKKYQVFVVNPKDKFVSSLNNGEQALHTQSGAQALIDEHLARGGSSTITRQVLEVSKPGKPIEPKPVKKTKYAVFIPQLDGKGWFRSAEVEGEFNTQEAAQTALDKYLGNLGIRYDHVERKVRPI